MPQTSVTAMTEAVAGLLADNTLTKDCLPGTSEESSAEIPFGVMVAIGTEDDGALLLHTSAAAMASKLKGVSVFGHGYAKPQELGDTGFKPKCTFDVLNKGRIYVLVEETVAVGDDVRVRVVTAGNEVKGAFRATQDSTDCVKINKFAKWIRGASSGGLAVVEIDMTNSALAEADV